MERQTTQLAAKNNPTIYREYFEEINSTLIAKGQTISATLAPLMLLQSSRVEDSREETILILTGITEILFGLRFENLNPQIWDAAFLSICERFKNVTVQDIKNAYKVAEIEKKAYTTLTRDELIKPISDYWSKKVLLLGEIERIKRKSEEEIEKDNRERAFKENARLKYIAALSSGTFDGDEFDAEAIARNFKDVFDQPFKNEIMKRAKLERESRLKQAEKISDFFVSVPSWEKIFSRIYIEECIKSKIKFIVP